MSAIGRAIGSLFDDPISSGQENDALAQQQRDLEAQQKAQLKAQKDALEKQRIAMMRGRFSGSGGAPTTAPQPGDADAAAASLFSRITGRNE